MINIILNWLRIQGYVNESNDKIIELGLQRIRSTLACILFSLIISWLMGDIIVGLIFKLTYIPIRIYAGGYHANSKRRCNYLSYGSMMICMILIFYVPMKIVLMNLLLLFSVIIIFLFSPIESPNKRLNSGERNEFRRKSIIYLAIIVITYVTLIKIKKFIYAKTIIHSITLIAIVLLIPSRGLKSDANK